MHLSKPKLPEIHYRRSACWEWASKLGVVVVDDVVVVVERPCTRLRLRAFAAAARRPRPAPSRWPLSCPCRYLGGRQTTESNLHHSTFNSLPVSLSLSTSFSLSLSFYHWMMWFASHGAPRSSSAEPRALRRILSSRGKKTEGHLYITLHCTLYYIRVKIYLNKVNSQCYIRDRTKVNRSEPILFLDHHSI